MRYLSKSGFGSLGRELNEVKSYGKRINSGYFGPFLESLRHSLEALDEGVREVGGSRVQLFRRKNRSLSRKLLLNWTNDFYTVSIKSSRRAIFTLFLWSFQLKIFEILASVDDLYSIFDCHKESNR